MDQVNIFLNYIRRFPLAKQFIKFCLIGGTSALINFLLYYFITERFFVWYVYSSIISFLISAIFNFSFNKLWTFRDSEMGYLVFQQIGKYAAVMGSGLFFNTLIIYGLTDGVGFDYRLSWVFATGLVTFWNFSFNRLWTFRRR
ncbi:MAG TPA: GtrA family protein [Patescibacteria group bacterium]|nr:GtrA family protein [Patescibacteria group bacterium]